MATSTVSPGATVLLVIGTEVGPILFPETNTNEYSEVQVQEPPFAKRQTFVNLSPGFNVVPSGIVTSTLAKSMAIRSQGTGAVDGIEVIVGGAEFVAGSIVVGDCVDDKGIGVEFLFADCVDLASAVWVA